MNHNPFSIKIKEPCSQDWMSMVPTGTGKFCMHCTKSVVDLSRMSDREIIGLIENTSDKICGRLAKDQSDRLFNRQPKNYRFPKILAGLTFLAVLDTAAAKNNPVEIVMEELPVNKQERTQAIDGSKGPDSLDQVINGRILDSTSREPLPFVLITIKGLSKGVQTDLDGRFSITIPKDSVAEKMEMLVSYVSYRKQTIVFKREELPVFKEVLLQSEEMLMGEIVIVKKKKWWQRKHR